MSMQDPISDMFTRIRNGQKANKIFVNIPCSKVKIAISKLLKDEGYIIDYKILGEKKKILTIYLKYFNNSPVIEKVIRISKPSLRIYKKKNNICSVINGLGIAIISTSKGIMTDKKARKLGVGGELICHIS
ncbi:30S ribosomal protein S8 [Buchnera aphidicola]|uniref:30S ribosomal protein S8 n=1 Tax=Buchnera aphidicola TaxID=9 RepID=UPI0030EDE3A9